MKSYRFARRSFLRGIGAGAVGLRAMLRNLESMAQGMASPPRFLMTHWPVGTIATCSCRRAPGRTWPT